MLEMSIIDLAEGGFEDKDVHYYDDEFKRHHINTMILDDEKRLADLYTIFIITHMAETGTQLEEPLYAPCWIARRPFDYILLYQPLEVVF